MNAYAVVDLQYGSTGKGLLAGYLAKQRAPDTVVCAFGPNAGHTFVEADGTRHVHVMMPMGALSPEIRRVLIGPGAVVHPELLIKEADRLRSLGHTFELSIHENAAVVNEHHRARESVATGTVTTGSTRKGTGAALTSKIMRETVTAGQVLRHTPLAGNVVTVAEYNARMDEAKILQIEGAQGFSLSHHHGFYPYVTSRDCTTYQLLADCAVPAPLSLALQVLGTCRTYPIRVNNRDGFSGPCYPDQEEVSWKSIGVAPELTTVTKLPRRVFSFSAEQIRQAIRMDGVDAVFLNFCNYFRDGAGREVILGDIKDTIEQTGAKVKWEGWGPNELDVKEI